MKRILAVIAMTITLVSCNDEAYESDSATSGNNPSDTPGGSTEEFLTIGEQRFWIYDVQSNSQDLPDMDFMAQDSVYVASISGASFTLSANDDGIANGSMNGIITNGTLSTTATTISVEADLELPDTFSNLGLDNNLEISNMLLLDLEANNNDIMFVQEANFSENLDIEGTQIPIQVNYELTTKKVNFYDSVTLNGSEYNNVFEGILSLSLSVSGTFNLGLFTQNVAILEPQNILETNYFYAEQVGLVRAESTQGFNLSSQLTALLQLVNIPLNLPTSVTVENIEELVDYYVE